MKHPITHPIRDSPKREKFISLPVTRRKSNRMFSHPRVGKIRIIRVGTHEGTPLRNDRSGTGLAGRWYPGAMHRYAKVISMIWNCGSARPGRFRGLMIGKVEIYLVRKFNVLEEEISVPAYFGYWITVTISWIT